MVNNDHTEFEESIILFYAPRKDIVPGGAYSGILRNPLNMLIFNRAEVWWTIQISRIALVRKISDQDAGEVRAINREER